MNTLQDVMTAPVITISPDVPVSRALEIMEQKKISSLVVEKDNRPLGIFTERALIQLRVHGTIDYTRPIHRVMSSPPFTAPADMDYREAYQLLLNYRIRHLVVTDIQEHLVGIVTGTDFLTHLGLEYFMEFKSVGQVMMRDVLSLPPSATAFTAMKLMHDRRVSSLVIERNGRPEGIVTERDLLRLIRSRTRLQEVQLQQVMSRPVQTIFSDVSSHKAAKILLEKGLRRLVVTSSSGRCVGIITETDLIKGLRTSYTDHLKEVINHQARQLQKVQKRMEEAEILDSMLQSAGEIAIAIMDPDFHILRHNQAAVRFFGADIDDLTGQNGAVFLRNGGMLAPFNKALAEARENGKSEFILTQQRDGRVHYLATTLFSIHDRQKNDTGFGLIALDITSQKQHELSLQAERDFSRKIIDAAPSIICSISQNGAIRFINPAGERLTGYSTEELLNKNWQDYFHAGNSAGPDLNLLRQFQENDVRGMEVELKTKDGTLRDISWSSVTRFEDKGASCETLILGSDITGLKKAFQEIEEANIALRVMLDQHTKTRETIEEHISVRLKTLVTPYLDLLRQSATSEQQAETINIITAHIDSIAGSFSPKSKEILLSLSPRESLIADLVRQGKTSKDIAVIIGISVRTVETYRNNLRKKLGINNRKISLRTYLATHFSR
ncbi:MAG TPA: CBS domain-containing protein [Desulfobulbus sp.]|nr:CBS domain-containing protein [Desulfobulbus sp.]